VNGALFGSFLLAAMIIQVVPGPGMLFIVANAVASGRRGGVAAACGAAAAMVVHTTAVALGFAALLRAAPVALAVVRIVGVLYLCWLAVQAFRATDRDPGRRGVAAGRRFWSVFARGALNNLANPKVVLFYVVFLPQFVDPSVGAVPAQLFVLGLVLLTIGLAVDVVVGMLAGQVGGFLTRRRLVNRVVSTVYAGLAIRLATTR
jgi:threonine/homoserine/homoserine lactone efflux protein